MRNLIAQGRLVAAALVLLVAGAVSAETQVAASEPPETRLVGVVNVNTATLEQLELLPGVGPARARSIVEHREASGPFKRADDLVAISGIGERALGAMRPYVSTSGKTTARIE